MKSHALEAKRPSPSDTRAYLRIALCVRLQRPTPVSFFGGYLSSMSQE